MPSYSEPDVFVRTMLPFWMNMKKTKWSSHSYTKQNSTSLWKVSLWICCIVFLKIHPTNSSQIVAQHDNDQRERRYLRIPQHYQLQASHSAIVILTTNAERDLDELCTALDSLRYLSGDKSSPVLVFNEGNLLENQMFIISKCTERTVAFPIIHLNAYFPRGFDPEKEWSDFEARFSFNPVPGRDRWSYAQMIRFWTVTLWDHPAIQQFESIMRIDTDSCFLKREPGHIMKNPQADLLPNLSEHLVYESLESPPSYNTYVSGLFEHAVKYITSENIKPSYPELWEMAKTMFNEEKNVPLFKTNFEVNRISFFKRPDVMKWHKSLSEVEPFGIWRYRWGASHYNL